MPVSSHASRDLILTVQIRKKCAQIDAQSQRATRRTIVSLEMAHEGSEITALSFGGQTRKLHVTHLGTMGKQTETIYLENGAPIWVTRIETSYDAPLSGRVVKRVEENLYFQKEKLIQRDFWPTTARRRDGNWIHETSITSPAQAREWKAKAAEWRAWVIDYQREMTAKK